MKIIKTAMEMSEAQEVIKAQTKALLSDPKNEELQAVLKANTETLERISEVVIKKDATLLPSTIVEIEVSDNQDGDVPDGVISYIDRKFDKIMESIAKINSGDNSETHPDGTAPSSGQETPSEENSDVDPIVKGIAMNIAIEVLNGYTSKIDGLKAMLEAGTEVSKDDMRSIFGWEVREAIENAVTVANIAKSDKDSIDKAKQLILDAITKNDEPGNDDDNSGENETPSGGETPDESDVEKSAGSDLIDLSPPLQDPEKTK